MKGGSFLVQSHKSQKEGRKIMNEKEYYEENEINRYNFLISLINDNYPFCDRETYSVLNKSPINFCVSILKLLNNCFSTKNTAEIM